MQRRTNVIRPVDSISTLVEQMQQTDSTVEDGEIVWVRSTQQLFLYRVNSGLVPNGTTIVASLYGSGVWVLTNLTLGGGGGGPPSGPAGGDLGGLYPNPDVVKINHATVPLAGGLTPGNVLQVSGASALTYAPVNLAGGVNFVTGVLPVANLPALAGDVTGAINANTVAKINGATVPAAGALTTGNVLQVTGVGALSYAAVNLAGGANFVTGLLPVSNIAPSGVNGQVLTTTGGVTVWAANAGGPPSGAASGDLGGTYPGPDVLKIHGATVPIAGGLTTGNVLQVTGVSALGYAAVNLAGGANFVTGVLPVANLPSLAGDVTGAINANTVGKINGSTVPAGGALTTGNVLQVTGVSALSYAAVNLAGGANFVTGVLPVANLPSLAGDVTGAINANTVAKINGATVPAAGALTTGNVLQVTGVSALGYAAVNLAGGANFVTGVLPVANLPSLAGDVTGAINANLATRLTSDVTLFRNAATATKGNWNLVGLRIGDGTAATRALEVAGVGFFTDQTDPATPSGGADIYSSSGKLTTVGTDGVIVTVGA
jgi:hypothetical protein